MNQVQKFNFALMDLRVIELESQPWFVAKDICETLGLHATQCNGSYQPHYRRLAPEELSMVALRLPPNAQTIRYKLISESSWSCAPDKTVDKAFQNRVTPVVLPNEREATHGDHDNASSQ